jgi:hypothetical protein
MSSITDTEIRHLTKEQNYFRGYHDATEDILSDLKQIKDEIIALKPTNKNFRHYEGETRMANNVLEILDEYIGEKISNDNCN